MDSEHPGEQKGEWPQGTVGKLLSGTGGGGEDPGGHLTVLLMGPPPRAPVCAFFHNACLTGGL